jgi:hypothetical protein
MELNRNTPRAAKPPLKFANRVYDLKNSTPLKRFGTPPQNPSARKPFNRDELPASNLSKSSISAARNIFHASSIANSPNSFSPQLPASTMKKVFAPATTPSSKRLFRDSIAHPTPRGMATKTSSGEFFTETIPSPPPELTGELLAKEIPDDWDGKGSVYADQYLAHLCPREFDDLQRRQFFCILDMRRLKYAANDIFIKKDWKLNVTNFAKEFEKSRNLIMLRYGLYEFQNKKIPEDLMKRWRAAHGIADPAENSVVDTPVKTMNGTKSTSMKRKAEEDLPPKEAPLSTSTPNKNKRRAVDKEDEGLAATPAANKNKRKASVSDEPDENLPTKVQKSTPSLTKALFERVASGKTGTSPSKPVAKPPQFGATLSPNPFAATAKPVNGGLARSILEGVKPGTPQPSTGSNIFSYLSDAGSAQNSGVEADAESESESESEQEADPQGAGQSYEPSVAASGGADTPSSLPGTAPFGKRPPFTSGLGTGPSSTSSEARESTPGRSIFDRIRKDADGQPVRVFPAEETENAADAAEDETEPAPVPVHEEPKLPPGNNIWNPNTPIKFGTSASQAPIFGASAAPSTAFAPKPLGSSNIFGSSEPSKPQEPDASKPDSTEAHGSETDKSGNESDKENSSKPASKSQFGVPSGTTPAPSIFQHKASTVEAREESKEASKPSPSPYQFGAASMPEESKPALAPSASNASVFTSQTKPAASLFQSSTLFGNQTKPATPAPSEAAKPAGIIGTGGLGVANAPLFASQPALGASSIFGTTPAVPKPIFGASLEAATPKDPVSSAASASSAPTFTWNTNTLTGPAKTPAIANTPAFGGSPMKQDDPSPAKKLFTSGSTGSTAAGPIFSFGAATTQSAASANPFGASTALANPPAPQVPVMFGGSNDGGSSFNFTAGAAGLRNPFASNNDSSASTPSSSGPTGTFNFSSGSAAPAAPSGGNSPFVFGGGSGSAPPAPAPSTGSTPFLFGGGSQPAAPATSATTAAVPFVFGAGASSAFGNTPKTSMLGQKPLFGAAPNAPSLSITAPSPQAPSNGNNIFAPKPSQPAASAFGNPHGLAGGTSTTGTSKGFGFPPQPDTNMEL